MQKRFLAVGCVGLLNTAVAKISGGEYKSSSVSSGMANESARGAVSAGRARSKHVLPIKMLDSDKAAVLLDEQVART